MRQREVMEFRTPQHPSLGKNNWGGASPLLARDIPKESLEERYLKLNSIRTRDDDFIYLPPETAYPPSTTRPARRKGFFSKLLKRGAHKEINHPPAAAAAVAVLGSNSKHKRWFPRWDPANRWPQGWC